MIEAATVQADVWVARHPDPHGLRDAWDLLDVEERERAGRFRFTEHRQQFVWRRAMRRWVLAACTGVPADRLHFDCRCRHCGDRAHGKPLLAGSPDVRFSTSQSGWTTVVAVTTTSDIGVDVQMMPSGTGFLWSELAEEEHSYVPPDRPDDALLTAWTRKEAYLKAIGVGVTVDLRTVPVLGRQAVYDDEGQPWHLTTVPLEGGVLSVACGPGRPAVRLRPLSAKASHARPPSGRVGDTAGYPEGAH